MVKSRVLGRAAAIAASVVVLSTSAVWADDISNNIDASIDAVAEVMSLNVGGSAGGTSLYVSATGAGPDPADGKAGCNLTGSSTLVLAVSSSNVAVAAVSPTSVTFTSCGDVKALTITPFALGSTTISVAQTSNSTGGTFNLAPATFTVNVAGAANTAPQIAITGVTAGDSYEFGTALSPICQVTDVEDGNSSFAASVTGTGVGEQTASCSYTDGGGLIASASVSYFIVDTTAPVIAAHLDVTAEATGASGANVSYTSPATSDAVDGPGTASCLPASGSLFALGDTTVTCNATDNAGNDAIATTFKVIVQDTTAPTLTLPANITAAATGPLGAAVTYSASASDLVDGSVTVNCSPASGSTFPVGTTSVNCSATDAHGNTATGSFTVGITYAWDGFYRPIDNLPILNSVKAGSAIPVKFSLGGNMGLNIFAAGSPASKVVACDAAATTDAIEETVTAGGSSLTYDASANQYVYVWKTDKSWAGTCRQLQLKLADGTTHAANFKLTK